jgi:hypothetical protein
VMETALPFCGAVRCGAVRCGAVRRSYPCLGGEDVGGRGTPAGAIDLREVLDVLESAGSGRGMPNASIQARIVAW